MTREQESHLARVKQRFAAAVDHKYRAGAAEHGGTLLDASPLALIRAAKEEAIDQWVYLDTLEEALLREPLTDGDAQRDDRYTDQSY